MVHNPKLWYHNLGLWYYCANGVPYTATPGVADKENPVISCLLISTAYEHPKFQIKQ